MIPRRILIVDPAFAGDVVFDGPLVRALVAARPDVEIGLVTRPPSDAVARRMIGVAWVHVYDKYRRDRGVSGLRRVARELDGYDVALIPHPSIRSAALAAAAGIPVRIGARTWPARTLLTRTVASTNLHVRLRLDLLDGLDPTIARDADLAGTLRADPPPPGPRRIGLVLGANWATKRWPVERAAEFVRSVSGATIVLLGSDGERPLGDAVRALAPGAALEDGMGGTFDALLDRLASCHVVVGGDTGPVHAARAMGRPAILLFGPTPTDTHVFTARDRLLTVDIACRPCHAHGPPVCPLGHHRCLVDLDAGRVIEALPR